MKSGESQEKTEASFSKLGIATIIVADTCFAQKVGSSESALSGRLKIAQRFIAGIGWNRDEVREADDRKG